MTVQELQAAWNAQADKQNQWDELGLDEIVYFAQQIEREACAKVCEAGINTSKDWDSSIWDQACENRAIAIRARSNPTPTQEKT